MLCSNRTVYIFHNTKFSGKLSIVGTNGAASMIRRHNRRIEPYKTPKQAIPNLGYLYGAHQRALCQMLLNPDITPQQDDPKSKWPAITLTLWHPGGFGDSQKKTPKHMWLCVVISPLLYRLWTRSKRQVV